MKKIFKIAFGLGLTTGIGGIVGLIWQAQIASVSWPLAAFFITLATLGTMAIVGATIAHNWSRVEQSEMPPSGGKEQSQITRPIKMDYSTLDRFNYIISGLGIQVNKKSTDLKIINTKDWTNGNFNMSNMRENSITVPTVDKFKDITLTSTNKQAEQLPDALEILHLAITCPESSMHQLLTELENRKEYPNKKELVTKLITSYSPAEDRPQPRP